MATAFSSCLSVSTCTRSPVSMSSSATGVILSKIPAEVINRQLCMPCLSWISACAAFSLSFTFRSPSTLTGYFATSATAFAVVVLDGSHVHLWLIVQFHHTPPHHPPVFMSEIATFLAPKILRCEFENAVYMRVEVVSFCVICHFNGFHIPHQVCPECSRGSHSFLVLYQALETLVHALDGSPQLFALHVLHCQRDEYKPCFLFRKNSLRYFRHLRK
uniref:Uncharacterized protein n=1 Tax=Selenomonas ruminantium TaxID=971 RepID=Q55009_SELRU|nr:hypothetical protein [Selenomonas ruminantium]